MGGGILPIFLPDGGWGGGGGGAGGQGHRDVTL